MIDACNRVCAAVDLAATMPRLPRRFARLYVVALTLTACTEIDRPGLDTGRAPAGPDDGSEAGGGTTTSSDGAAEGSSTGAASSGDAMADGSSGGSSSGAVVGESSSSGDAVTCDLSTHVCTPPAPAGWNGPVARAQVGASDDSACGGAFGNAVASGGLNLVANPASCDCDCGNPSGDTCDDSTTAMYYPPNFPSPGNNAVSCQFSQVAFEIGTIAAATGAAQSRWRFLPVGPSGGSCAAMPSTNVPSAYFSQRVDLCGPSEAPATCEDASLCVPQPDAAFEPEMCVWRYGDVTCPSAYPEKQVTYNDVSDSRGCSSCTCGAPSGQTCPDASAYVVAFGAHEFPADGSCVSLDAGGDVTAMWFDPGSPHGGSCTPSSVHATGSATAIDALTVCCAGA